MSSRRLPARNRPPQVWRRVLPALGLLLAAAAPALASGPNLQWRLQFNLAYEDNPFLYSSSDLDRFRFREEPARFPIRTSDDLEANPVIGLTWRYRAFARGGSVALQARLHDYFSNPEKSYGSTDLEFGQYISGTGRLRLTYSYLPNYLLRYFKDLSTPDTGDFAACRLSEHLAGIGLRQRLGPVIVTPSYGYEYDGYAAPFSYYDARAHRPGVALEWEVARNFSVKLDYEFQLAAARGPVPDASFRQHEAGVSVVTQPRRLNRFSFEAGYSYARRQFTTLNPGSIDPAHAGRVDQIESARVEARYRLEAVTLVFGYQFEWRTVSSAFSAAIEDVKDYRASRASIGVLVNSGKAG